MHTSPHNGSQSTTRFIPALLCGLISLGFFGWALWGQGLSTLALRWTVATVGMSAGLWALTENTRWREASTWTVLALIGQACALQLLVVGNQNHLQLFDQWRQLLGTTRIIFILVVVVQAAAVVWGGWPVWKEALARRVAVASWTEITLVLVLCAFAAVAVAPATVQAFIQGELLDRLGRQASKVALGLFVFGAGALNLILAARAIPSQAWENAVARWKASERRWLPGMCALWVVLVSSLLAWFVFERVPHVPDEVAYLFQAKYFSAGKLYLDPPPVPAAFSCSLMLFDPDKWYSAQLPAWPLVLAVGAWLGVPWLVNPLLGGLGILLAHVLVRRLYGRGIADGTVLLLAGSPWLLHMSASLFGHPVSLVFALAGLLGVERARESGSLGGALAGGLFFGVLAAVRPVEAMAVASVAGLWWLSAAWKRLRLAALCTTLVAGLAMTGLQLAYNKVLTGDPLYFPFEKVFDLAAYPGSNRVGFGPDVGNLGWGHLDPLTGHGPADVVVNTNHNLYMINFDLFGWASGSLLLVFGLLATGRLRRDLLMWGLAFSIWLWMSPYWFSGGPDIGARYWYQMIVPLSVLTVRGAQEFSARWNDAREGGQTHNGQRVWGFVVLASLVGFANLMPWRALDKYRGYRGVTGEVRKLEKQHDFGRSLVFVRGEMPGVPWLSSEFASAFALNPPTFDRAAPGPIYVRDMGEESREILRRYYADRPAWILAVPELTRDGFKVMEGPLPPLGLSLDAPSK